MNILNPYRAMYKTLEEVAAISPMTAAAVDILDNMDCDVVHDKDHILRVVRKAVWYGQRPPAGTPKGDVETIAVAALLHDLVNVPKDSPNRSKASIWSAGKALDLLYHRGFLRDESTQSLIVRNAIEAHSWTGGIAVESFEAACLQDADRMESLGALGIARVFAAGGAMGRPLFHPTDPTALNREPDEIAYTLDHYYVKLVKLVDNLKTPLGQIEGKLLFGRMEQFIKDLLEEL
jgi:uncharacterized protein